MMNGIGWTEILVVAACALIVVGPKDLPNMLRNIGKVVGKARRMSSEFRREFNKVLYDDDISGLKKTFTEPLGDIRNSIDKDIKKINDEVMAKAPKGDEMEPIADMLKETVGKKTPTKKPVARKAPVKKPVAKTSARKTPVRKATVKKTVTKKPATRKTPAKAIPVKAVAKPAAKKPAPKKTLSKKPAAKKPVAAKVKQEGA